MQRLEGIRLSTTPENPLEIPEDFLRTVNSVHNFAEVTWKLKKGAKADANIQLTRDDCISLIWALQLLSGRPKDAVAGD